MRKLYVKCSDFRNFKYSITTSIIEDKGKKYILKSPVFKDGNEHIMQIMKNNEILTCYFSEVVDICAAELVGNSIRFDFINGESLADKYARLVLMEDKQGIMKLTDEHLKIIKGNLENVCEFYETEISKSVFGDLSAYIGEKALKISNFEATARNIFLDNNKFCFIDYEWVFNVPLPLELIIYHCIVKTAYMTIPGLSSVITQDKMLEYLKITDRMQVPWTKFLKYINSEPDGVEYEKIKSRYIKNTIDISGVDDIKLVKLKEKAQLVNEYHTIKGEKFELELKALETMQYIEELQKQTTLKYQLKKLVKTIIKR